MAVKENLKTFFSLARKQINRYICSMILKYAFLAFVFWLLYKLVFDFIVPVYQSTKHVRRQMGDIQEHLRRQYQQQEQAQRQTAQAQQQQTAPKKADKGDYLDFEEIK